MPTNAQLVADAKRHLDAYFEVPMPTDFETLAKFFRDNHWIPESDNEKIQLAACAYAMTLLYGLDKELIDRVSDSMDKTRAHSDPIRVFVEAIYETIELSGKKKSHLFSKYTAAIRYLKAKGVLPSEVERLAGNPGEGLDAWSRKAAKPRKTSETTKISRTSVTPPIKFIMKVGTEKKSWLISDGAAASRFAKSLDRLEALHPGAKPKAS